MEKKVALVLGGTNPHVTLMKKLKERGYYTILVDYLPNPPAKEMAEMHIMESTLDKNKVLEIAQVTHASLVITTNIDQANVTACYVAEKLGLPHPYSYETALNVTKKDRMKRIMCDNDIPTLAYITVETVIEALHADLSYPVVVKPIDSNGSRGVHKCNSDEELKKYLSLALKTSRAGRAIIEKFIDGEEISFYYFIQEGKPYYITSNQRFKYHVSGTDTIQSGGGIYPAQQPQSVYSEMELVAGKIAKVFGLQNTPLFIQAIVRKEKIYVLEFAPRIGGGLSFRLIEQDNNFDIINAAINSFLGLSTHMDMQQSKQCSATMNIYAPGITVENVTGVESAIEERVAKEFHQYKLRGAETREDMSSGSRVGCFFIQGKDFEEIKHNIRRVNELVEVTDSSGAKRMKHDIYCSLE